MGKNAHTPRTAPRPTILVVDDDADMREAVAMVLRTHGWTVHAADGGRAGLVQLSRLSGPVLMLLDWHMPGMGGAEVLAQLPWRAGVLPLAVIVMAASSRVPAQGWPVLRKPFALDHLLDAVAMSLAEMVTALAA